MIDSDEKPTAKYFSLSPLSDIQAPVYFEALNEKLNDNSIKNIAIIGPYGSGKSSVIESFILTDTKNKYLRVSLANFCETNNEITEEIEKKIEEQILQQLYYQLAHDDIPFSGFKKISHIDKKHQQTLVYELIIWLFSLAFIPGVFKTLNQNLLDISSSGFLKFLSRITLFGTIFNLIILIIFSIGLFYLIKEIIRLKQKGQFKKLVMKSAQLELAEDSALNKYIDELIYFFEATEKNIVIIEDLDRFNSVMLFSKLKEVNFLINNSPKVTQSIKFVYAIKDDIFSDNYNRTKFFDFILPIVPVINTTNSGDKLREMLLGKYQLASNYINDISLYIFDLRLLKNIVNEYKIYNDIINNENKKRGVFLFSLILYKNLFPKEFSVEHSRGGLLFNIFKEKKGIILEYITKDKLEKSENFEIKKNEILSETVQSEIKLHEEYIFEIQRLHSDIKSICNSSVIEMLAEENFKKLLTNPKVETYYNYGNGINFRVNEISIDFNQIQKKVNPNKTYEERLELIKRRKSGSLLKLELEIIKNKKEIESLHRKKLSELIKQYKDNSWEAKILEIKDKSLSQEQKLLMLLLRKGYIEENYLLYISYFYEGALSLKDFEFLLNVKNNEGGNFDTKLSNVNEIISRISEDEFEYSSALNKDIISNLLNRFGFKSDTRVELLFQQFEQNEESFEEYILPLIYHLQGTQKELQRFIDLLVVKYYPTIWKKIDELNLDETRKVELLKMFLFLSEENIQSLNAATGDDSLKNYLSAKNDFFEAFYSPIEIGNLTKLIKALNLKFQRLTFNRYDSNQVFNYIYQNNHYKINKDMLYLMLYQKYNISHDKFDELFYTQNYTCIYESSDDVLKEYIISNFDAYIENIYLQLEPQQNESEDAINSFIDLLSEEEDNDTIFAVLGKISSQIVDIEKFGKEEKWSLLFESNCVLPNWNNVIYYFKLKEKTLNKTITKWLNHESICEILTQHKFKFDENVKEKDSVISLQRGIIENDKLTSKSYELLIASFPYKYPEINLEELSKEKITRLIEYNKLIFNPHHYKQLLNLDFKDGLLAFTISDLESFLKDYQVYDFSLELNKGILDSNSVVISDKRSLTEKISIENISDSKFADSICIVLISTNGLIIENEKIIHLIKKSSRNSFKLKMLDKFLDNFDLSEIDIILESIGGVYKKASILRKRPIWENNDTNLSIAQKLQTIGYFNTVEINKKGEIKIVVRYF